MRATLILLSLTAVAAAGSAQAAGLVMPQFKPSHIDAYNAARVEQPWTGEQPAARIAEQPIGEAISRRLGLADGSAQLFRYQVQGTPSDKAVLDGMVDGGGIRLKLSW
ncbi:MAG: hypothetical protein ISS15_14405 [Alphaproteobacteria bacterium]|nr:hypothetical protein [Alphaproteobacteria bacterium]MBL6937509.1 hypothetical protein [Alphaproteobacteria bacterium]MBL7098847.1 hypothetical protein [Alphaproteobacteria bacterium]